MSLYRLENELPEIKKTPLASRSETREMAEYILEMERKLNKHRTGKITCPENCFCWEVDMWLAMMEAGE